MTHEANPPPAPNLKRPDPPPGPPPALGADRKDGGRLLAQVVADLVYVDPHDWSNRPCATCRAVSAIIDRPFGCDRYRQEGRRR